MATILLTGGTGLIGQYLARFFSAQGHKIRILSRQSAASANVEHFVWDIHKQTLDPRALEGCDFIIHLAGAGIADARWSAARKKEIICSRVDSTRLLAQSIAQTGLHPQKFISASAIGFYGNGGETIFDESSQPFMESFREDFMSKVCQEWENAAQMVQNLGVATSIARIGIVLSTQGGALAKMLPSYKLKIGAYFGNGRQYYSWIHLHDIARAFEHILNTPTQNLAPIYNLTAPNPCSNYELAQSIPKAQNTSALLTPVPAFGLRLAMGEMADVVLNSTRVLPKNLLAGGFGFEYPELVPALADLIRKGI